MLLLLLLMWYAFMLLMIAAMLGLLFGVGVVVIDCVIVVWCMCLC